MLSLPDLTAYLDSMIDPENLEDYCPNGLQIEGKKEIKKMATAVSASFATIEKAVAEGIDALIVHHGLFWKGDPFPVVGTKQKKLALLLKNEISVFAYHLPLDAHREIGNNWRAAQDLGWKNLEPFGVFSGTAIGVKGSFSPTSTLAFLSELEAYYEHEAMSAPGGQQTVSSAALISGGAYKELGQAAQEGLDCFITGNFDEPAWATAHEEKINFFALGHSATERVGVKALATRLNEQFDVPTTFIDIPNPF